MADGQPSGLDIALDFRRREERVRETQELGRPPRQEEEEAPPEWVDRSNRAARDADMARQALAESTPSPDEEARQTRAAERLGMAPIQLRQAPAMVRAVEQEEEIEQALMSPELTAWLAQSNNAALARDDINVLSRIGEVLGRREAPTEAAPDPIARGRNAFMRFVVDTMDGEWWRARATEAASAPIKTADDLTNPQWWARQAAATQRATDTVIAGVREFGRQLPDIPGDMAEQYRIGAAMVELADLEMLALTRGADALTPEQAARRDELTGMAHAEPRTWFGPAAQSWPFMASVIAEGAEGAWQGGLLGAGLAVAAGQAGPQAGLPEEIVTVPAGFGLGARTGFTTESTLRSGQLEAGLAYSEFRQMTDENGAPLDDDIARIAALGVGAANGLLETVSVRAALRAIPGGDALLRGMTRDRMRQLLTRPTFRQALGRAALRVGQVGAVEGVTEGLQELTVIIAGELAMNADGDEFYRPTIAEYADRVKTAAQYGFQAGTVFGGFGASAGLATDIPRARRAEQDLRVIDALASASSESALRNRLPQRFHAYIEALTAGGPLDTIWVDASRFREYFQEQGVDPRAVAEALEGVGGEAFDTALAARDDLAIPTATFATRIAGTPAYEGLREHVRLSPDADTLAEARHNIANDETVRARMADLERAVDLNDSELEAQQAITRAMRSQLDRAGVTVSDANAVQAEAISRAIVVLAQRGGANPIDLYQRFFGDIRGPDARGPARTMEQAPPDVAAFAASLKQQHGLADLRLSFDERRGDLVLDLIALDKKGQRRGAGGRAMADLIAFADQHGLRIRATPPKRGGQFGTTSQARARGFLERHGFADNAGEARDASVREAMIRAPMGQILLDQQESPIGTARFDAQMVDPNAGELPSAIPAVGTPEFALLLDAAETKEAQGLPLSYLEEWALAQVRGGRSRTDPLGVAREYTQEQEPIRARPLPPRRGGGARLDLPPAPSTADIAAARIDNPEIKQRLAVLIAKRDGLDRQIQERQQNERDLPEMIEARQDARAMRAASYCAARTAARRSAAVRSVAGGAVAAAGAGAVLAPGEIDPGGREIVPSMVRVDGPSAVASIPPAEPAPVQLPATAPDEAMADLPAEEAQEAELPEAMEEALAAYQAQVEATIADPDLPVTTNNRAARRAETDE